MCVVRSPAVNTSHTPPNMTTLRIGFVLWLPALLATYVSSEMMVCYFSSWAVYRPGNGKFDVDDIDPNLCTHLIFGFAGLSNQTWEIEVLDPWNELCPPAPGDHCAYDRFVALKEQNPNLITMLAVGGWNEGSEDFSRMAMDPAKRKSFIQSAVSLVLEHGFDGLDVDWEYPASRGGVPEDKENFATLMNEFREEFNLFTPPLLLSSALSAGKPTIDDAYDLSALAQVMDFMTVMGYDYHGAWENFTHHNAPICGYYLDWGEYLNFNVEFSVNYYLSLGVPREKLVLGIPAYGRCWTLDDINDHGILAPAHNPGKPGPYIRLPGTMGANEICERLSSDERGDCTVVHDPALHEPYFYCRSDLVWCGYDDADSAFLKARLAKNKGLAGVMVWTIDTDDFHSFCYNEPFHLIKAMKRALSQPAGGDDLECAAITPTWESTTSTTTTTTEPPTTTTTEPPTTTTTTEPPTTTTTEPPTTTTTTTTTEPPTTTTTEPPTTTTTEPPTTTTTEPPTTTTTTTTTTEPPTTTTTTTTTETPTTTTTTEPTTTTTPITTTQSTTTKPSTTHHPVFRPNCTGASDGLTFAHPDCNKFWECRNGNPIVMLCAGGTVWDESLHSCNWEENVDTSGCNLWTCQVDNIYYPAEDCNKYYWCYQGSPHLEQCAADLFWNQNILQCDVASNVDISTCNL